MLFAACTDHLYLNEGHSLDFANKAFELLDHIGWENAADVLASLVPDFVRASRMEESSSWRHPVDLPALLAGVYARLDGLIAAGEARRASGAVLEWKGHVDLAETILDGEPPAILDRLCGLVSEGVPLVELRTVGQIRLVTDSNGIAAFDEPGLIGLKVYFHVKSHGYEFARDGFGIVAWSWSPSPAGPRNSRSGG